MIVRRTISAELAALLFAIATFIVGCEHMDGRRIVAGIVPLDSKTVEAERIIESLEVPEGSSLLETQVRSKEESGVVTKKYSTEKYCEEVDSFYRHYLIFHEWILFYHDERGVFFPEIITKYSTDKFRIEIRCDEMRDFRGIRKFYITSSWNQHTTSL